MLSPDLVLQELADSFALSNPDIMTEIESYALENWVRCISLHILA